MNWLKTNGKLLMVLAALFFSSAGALAKFITESLPVSQVVFFRFLITIILIAPWMWYRRISFFGKNRPLLFARCLFGFVAAFLQYIVYSQLLLADAMILLYTAPIFVAILSTIFLKERFSLYLMVFIVCAFLGCITIVRPSFVDFNIYTLMAILSAFFAALAYLTIKKLHQTESFATIVFNFALFSVVVTLLIFYREFQVPQLQQALALLALGVCGTIAQVFLTYAYKYERASVVSPYSYSAVLYALLFGLIFWGEMPDLLSFLGMVVVVASGIGILKSQKWDSP